MEAAAGSRYHSDFNNALMAWKASKGVGDAWKHSQRDGNRHFTLVMHKISSPEAYRAVYKALHGVFTGLSLVTLSEIQEK